MKSRLMALVVCAVVAGCDSKPASPAPGPGPTTTPPVGDGKKEPAKTDSKNDPAAAPDQEIAISGKVSFDGTPPKRGKVQGIDSDPLCAAQYTEEKPLYKDELIVGADGAICDVLVWVKSGLEGRRYPAPNESMRVTQKGCHYHPHVFGIVAGQSILVVNDDGTTHNVHPLPKVNGLNPENTAQRAGQENTWTLPSPEGPFRIKCDIHPWMSCFCLVSPHPYFVVTGGDGAFELKNLPPGEYEIEAWTEKLGAQSKTVTVGGDKKKAKIDFTFKK